MFEAISKNGRWLKMTLSEQLANIGSEVARALKWRQERRQDYFEKAFGRALELYDLTLSDKRWRHRAKEITRSREVVCDFFYGGNKYNSSASSIDNYFLQFARSLRR